MSDSILEILENYATSHGLYESASSPRFPIMDFYLEICSQHNIYGVVAEDLQLVDVGKLDTLATAETFISECRP